MTDLALIQNPDTGKWDLGMTGPDLTTDAGLQTAIVWSLITDKRATADDILPDGSDDRRGNWGDAWPEIDGHQLGSRDWIVLNRAKQTQETLNAAIDSARDALQWLIDQGIAANIDVTGEWVRSGLLGRTITVTRPNGATTTFRYDTVWRAV